MSKLIHNIREFFWPLLEGKAKHYQITPEKIQEALVEENGKDKINELLALSKSIYEREENRRKTVEAKATTLLSAAGLTITLIVSFGKSLFFEFEKLGSLTISVFAIFFVVTLVYFWRTIAYSLRALSKSGCETMMPDEIIQVKGNNEEGYKKKMAEQILVKAAKNYPHTNVKVDWMTMSLEYFKRGIYTVIIGTIVLSILGILRWADYTSPLVERQKIEKAAHQKSDIDVLTEEVASLKKKTIEIKEENEFLRNDVKDLQKQLRTVSARRHSRNSVR